MHQCEQVPASPRPNATGVEVRNVWQSAGATHGGRVVAAAAGQRHPAQQVQPLRLPHSRFCEFPQEVGIAFLDGVVNVEQIQLLSHQSKIATRIELFVGTGDDYFRVPFTRLGYLSLDSNERSQYKARVCTGRTASHAPL